MFGLIYSIRWWGYVCLSLKIMFVYVFMRLWGNISNTPFSHSFQPGLIRIVISVRTVQIRVDSNQLALTQTPLESGVVVGLKGVGEFAIILNSIE